jgi:hypothetical protein
MNVYLAGKHCNTIFLVVVLLIYYVHVCHLMDILRGPQVKFDSIDDI